jgi:hypothetical protein
MNMKRRNLSLPEIGLIAGTRAALGAGVGLLLADRFEPSARRAVGWTLLGVGAITTVPILIQLLGSNDAPTEGPSPLAELDDERPQSVPGGLVGAT